MPEGPGVLDTDVVEVRLPPEKAADDVAVEVLVRGEAEHPSRFLRDAPSQEAVSDALRIETPFVLATDFFGLAQALAQVGVDFLTASQIVADHRVDVGQVKGGILLRDLFRRCPFAERGDHRVQSYAGATDAHDTLSVGPKGH